jgi:hypothetical protein
VKINQNNMEFLDWAAAVGQQLALNGMTLFLDPDEDWREWTYRLMMLPQIAKQNAPRSIHFDDWREWASAFNQSVEY